MKNYEKIACIFYLFIYLKLYLPLVHKIAFVNKFQLYHNYYILYNNIKYYIYNILYIPTYQTSAINISNIFNFIFEFK